MSILRTKTVITWEKSQVNKKPWIFLGLYNPINCSAYFSSTKKPPLANRRRFLIYSGYVAVYHHSNTTPEIQPSTKIAITAQMILSSCFLIMPLTPSKAFQTTLSLRSPHDLPCLPSNAESFVLIRYSCCQLRIFRRSA